MIEPNALTRVMATNGQSGPDSNSSTENTHTVGVHLNRLETRVSSKSNEWIGAKFKPERRLSMTKWE